MRYHRPRHEKSNPVLVTLIAVTLVFGGYFLWSGFMNWADQEGQTRRAEQTTEALVAASETNRPTLIPIPSRTPLPGCQIYSVNVESAYVRECPSIACDWEDRLEFQTDICVYEKVTNGEYPDFAEWYVVDLNAGGVFTDIVYIHESVIEPKYPTPRPSMTFTALPTITLTPTITVLPTNTPVPACQWWYVHVSSANLRICPSANCNRRSLPLYQGDQVCVLESAAAYSRAYEGAEAWYIVDLNAGQGELDLWFMHESGIRPLESSTLTPTVSPQSE